MDLQLEQEVAGHAVRGVPAMLGADSLVSVGDGLPLQAIMLDGVDLFEQYDSDGSLEQEEQEARDAKQGIKTDYEGSLPGSVA